MNLNICEEIEEKEIKNKYNYGVSLMKLIAAICVIAIHTYPLFSINEKLDLFRYLLCTWAVPFFFSITGFYLFNEDNVIRSVVMKRQLFKLFRLYIVWTIIYLPIIVKRKILVYDNIFEGILNEVKDTLFIGSYFQLWYLIAVIWCFVIMLEFKNVLRNEAVRFVLWIPYLFSVVYTYYRESNIFVKTKFDFFWEYTGNGLNAIFFGLPFILLCSYNNLIKSKEKNIRYVFIAILIWIIEGGVLYICFNTIKQQMFSLPFLIYFIINLINDVDLNKLKISNAISKHMRDLSVLLFFTHTFNITVINEVLEYFMEPCSGELFGSTGIFFIAVLFVSWCEAECIIWLNKRIKIFKYLYL